MRRWASVCLGLMAMSLVTAQCLADNLAGAQKVLCSSVTATVCSPEEDCTIGAPWEWNIPQFLEVDFNKKTLSTTKASGQARTTTIKHLERADGVISLQGFENGRAFSFVIEEDTGMVSVAVARKGMTVAVFGMCTPMAP
jgi:hypothetical protein